MKNLWILTEERPKNNVLLDILRLKYSNINTKPNDLQIIPRIINGKFQFIYDIKNIVIPEIKNIYLKIVSGKSSFVDYLVVLQDNEPKDDDKDINILYAVEETKTTDNQSRNTAVYQRATKFVYLDLYYPNIKKYMLYNYTNNNTNKKPSDTNIFGTNMMLTIGVNFHGKDISNYFKKFKTVDDLINFKSSMKSPPANNTPITITKESNIIKISGMLSKPSTKGNIAHDPNIGALSLISKSLRMLGWKDEIIITNHGVKQEYIDKTKGRNKFLYLCNNLDIKLENINININIKPDLYWYYENKSEKIVSIFTHIYCENNDLISIYENHAGCERGYFYTNENQPLIIPKKCSKQNKINIPDLILYSPLDKEIIIIEAKQYSKINAGINALNTYNSIENHFIKKYYEKCNVTKWVILFGENDKNLIKNEKVLLYLTKDGDIMINKNSPKIFKNIFKNNTI